MKSACKQRHQVDRPAAQTWRLKNDWLVAYTASVMFFDAFGREVLPIGSMEPARKMCRGGYAIRCCGALSFITCTGDLK